MFISCSKYNTLIEDVNSEGGYVGGKEIWELSVLSTQLYCKPNFLDNIK